MKRNRSRRPTVTQRQAALSVVQRLHDSGHSALFTGGCVRDMQMGKRPKDYDIATEAHPDQIVRIFRRTRKVGIKFGVVLVGIQQHWVEVATFRCDGDYKDGRHPERVRFTDAREDALRRDFTINGMFYDPLSRELIDYVDGLADIKAGVLRAIGDAETRFAEDHLRMLRAIRFAARFEFEIESRTWRAIRDHAESIRKMSPERIYMELEAILRDAHRGRAFELLARSGLLPHLWAGAGGLSDRADMIVRLLAALPAAASVELALAAVLHSLAPSEANAVCKALCCSNRTTKGVTWLVDHQGDLSDPSTVSLADLKLLMAAPSFAELPRLLKATLRAAGLAATAYRQIAGRVAAIPAEEVAPPPLITGKHLGRLGLRPGPTYKDILERVYYAQLNGDLPDRAAARAMARKLVRDYAGGG